ncbi:ShlB/FhaC/HecB family hemolysin secretion/activation protein [Pannus brasiliensis CCIBt3594]|uniref:ShlB/FhaC/HecB family hemolysin secretion/activation protein n=1 Tax=Pannus brasiliensis CCIBt3594 TaxID=1427578 RepID=A0AAW9QVH2_9CHRO
MSRRSLVDSRCIARSVKLLLAIEMCLSLCGGKISAQVRPGIVPRFPLPPQTPEPVPLPRPAPEAPLELPSPSFPAPETPDVPGSITVTRFEFEGNTAFSNRQLQEVTAPFTGRPIAFSELLQAEAAVTKLYTDAGYINSGAVIPAGQTFRRQGAVVKIRVIEGGVEEIAVTVDGRLNPGYVRSRLALATTRPLDRDRLLEALQLLQLDPLIETISAELSAGTSPESSILTVRVKEADTFYLEAFADNNRVSSIGNFERGIELNQGNVTGLGDRLNIRYANTDGSNAVSAGYTVPINPYNGTISLSAQWNFTKVIEEPFDRLDIEGDADYYEVNIRQPILQSPTREVALGATLTNEESYNRLLGEGFPLSPGASDRGRTGVSALRLIQEWTERGQQDVLALRSQFSIGVDLFNATINEKAPDSQFFTWLAQGQYARQLAPDTLFVFRFDLQLADRPLLSLEQYGLGGLYSVRGYSPYALLTDNAFFASVETRLPILRLDKDKGVLQLVPFVDFGVGWNASGNPIPTPDTNTLLAVGLGLQYRMGNNFSARFDWGIPLFELRSPNGGAITQQNIFFSINYRFF